VRLLQQALRTLVSLPPPPPLPSSRCSKSEQINSDPNSALGSLPYTAPEVLSNTMRHGHQADVWSLGVALYKMCVGLYPFERLEDAADARTAVQVGPLWGSSFGAAGGRRLVWLCCCLGGAAGCMPRGPHAPVASLLQAYHTGLSLTGVRIAAAPRRMC
jgi:serine/threonine protein kinase